MLRAAWFMIKDDHTAKLEALNAELRALPACDWKGKIARDFLQLALHMLILVHGEL